MVPIDRGEIMRFLAGVALGTFTATLAYLIYMPIWRTR